MTVREIIKKVFLTEILKGMALTLKYMFTHAVTRQYPEEKRPPFPGFRGLHALPRKADGAARCVGCGLCSAVCPSQCIKVYTSEGPNHEKIVDRYEVEVLRCVFCALCVEACPFQAIVLTDCYEYSDYSRDALYMTKEKLLENWDRFAASGMGEKYFEKFWRPKISDFAASDEQAVFKGSKDRRSE
jgi:NADH-quinone oxidoreductase subunit I